MSTDADPAGAEPGETWVALMHRPAGCPERERL
jgi:hypothetical protein